MIGTPIAKGVWLVNAGVKFAPDLEAEKNAHNSVKESEEMKTWKPKQKK